MTQTQPEGDDTLGGAWKQISGTAGVGDTAGHHLREVQSEDGTASLFKAELAGDVVTSFNGDAFVSARPDDRWQRESFEECDLDTPDSRLPFTSDSHQSNENHPALLTKEGGQHGAGQRRPNKEAKA